MFRRRVPSLGRPEASAAKTGPDGIGALGRGLLGNRVVVGVPDSAEGGLTVVAFQPVGIQDPIKVICLVLEATCEHAFSLHRDRIAVQVHAGCPGGPKATHREAQAGNGKATLHLVRLEVLTVFQDRVDDVAFHSPPMR